MLGGTVDNDNYESILAYDDRVTSTSPRTTTTMTMTTFELMRRRGGRKETPEIKSKMVNVAVHPSHRKVQRVIVLES